ncbi:hypothetical protein X928_08360 [Petrotoga miotherma DSM 10691]|uniref:Uncharacterized protein n=1 Tax=Petrotoga miotherma DSM 10691 TaxID=1434326 RepID=A0A2K1P8G0_9BACT|nr:MULTISPECIES: hypothetical protein [Petrotoga]PNR98997.1 hypothetical protein X928_08360 [Petrotoga miotherma DSM 10691]
MLAKKEVYLSGWGDMCCRSHDAAFFQSDFNEFETEILEALARIETEPSEIVLKNEE